MKLVPIKPGSNAPNKDCEDIHAGTLAYYDIIGYHEPWVSYYLCDENKIVGCCSFKGKPDSDNRVELAYYTFSQFEGKGYGSKMCKLLKGISCEHKNVTLFAKTLARDGASPSILKKNGFKCTGTVIDPEDGEVWEWLLA